MELDDDAVRHIARLARIHVPDSGIPALRTEMNGILGWMEQLVSVDLDGVPPLDGAAGMALRLRDDAVADGNIRDRLLANAPETDGEHFLVPKVVD